ncbi:hypothetical protein RBI02_08775 [Thermococcus waiotapuensis]|uniref:Non-canonical purine NTP phosphatase/PRRC1 domain-containing protein n=1 Tax=Thermococcus waiotapuensis TaxID=90909 RepID=A0AAE4NVF6_9EURY|nr:DUF84 family protein [Thermococcus waiotapuensis]MDV3104624.1 hypothetical protein [Thermococcus waiotapuensis]
MNRAKQALEKGKADIGVGIEAGVYPAPNSLTGYFDIQLKDVPSPTAPRSPLTGV